MTNESFESAESSYKSTDVAALAASAVAISVSTTLAPGPFSLTGMIIAGTLLTTIYAYVWKGKKAKSQVRAISATIGLIFVPIVGFFLEILSINLHITNQEIKSTLFLWKIINLGGKNLSDDNISNVGESAILISWFIVSIITYITHRRKQR